MTYVLPDTAILGVEFVREGSSWFLNPELSNPIQSPLVYRMQRHIEAPKFVQGLFVEGTVKLNGN
jgi:hypothetical protein